MAETTRRRAGRTPIDRRAFLRYSLLGSVSAGVGGFGLASLGFLWPRAGDGLFGEVPIAAARELVDTILGARTPVAVPEAGLAIVTWDPTLPAARTAYGDAHVIVDDAVGLMAVNSRACPHLGCAVPWCQSSQWFECPCHGSRYNRYGEWTGGPAPRGLDRFRSFVDGDGNFVVDLGTPLTGPARTANALKQSREGPSCVDA